MIRRLAQALAVCAGGGLAVLWVRLVFFDPARALSGAGPPAWLATAIFGGLGLAAAVAALRRAPLVVGISALVSFFPVGFYVLALPPPFRWIGVLDLLLLVSALMLWRVERDAPPPRESDGDRDG